MTSDVKPAKLVEIDGKQYVVADRAEGSGSCSYCAFESANDCISRRSLCRESSHLLSLADYTKQKLKGEVL